MQTEQVSITFQINKSDVVKFVYFHLLSNTTKLIYMCILYIVFVLCIKLAYISSATTIILLSTLTMICTITYVLYRKAINGFRNEKAFRAPLNYTFKAEEISSNGINFNSTFNWERIHGIKWSKNYIYFYVNKNSALIIPRRALDENQTSSLKSIIQSAIGASKSVKSMA
jgi:hypothetical protein